MRGRIKIGGRDTKVRRQNVAGRANFVRKSRKVQVRLGPAGKERLGSHCGSRQRDIFLCAIKGTTRERERERPFYVACIERLYSRLGFDTLELMISSSTSINSFPVKERLDPIVFPRVEQLDRVAFPPGDPPNGGRGEGRNRYNSPLLALSPSSPRGTVISRRGSKDSGRG